MNVAYLPRPVVIQMLSHAWRPCPCGLADCAAVEVVPLCRVLGPMVALGLGRWGDA